jgi:DNA polymerase-4
MTAISGSSRPWPRVIAMVDMNAFFAAIEQRDDPNLAGRPVAVTNGLVGTCVITCSYEARAFGVHTGMHIKAARRACPGLIRRPARPQRYAEISTRIMTILEGITPEVEVFSVDEAFLEVTRCQRLWGPPEAIARLIKERVRDCSGLLSSVGVSGDKSTAKYAAKLHKPDGLTIIPPWEARQRLENVPVTALCGVNQGIGAFLARRGALTCGQVARLPISVLGDRFGNPGRRIWHMCRGSDPEPVRADVRAPRSLGHGKVVPPDTRDRETLYMYLIHMAEKVAARLRQNALRAQRYFIGLKCGEGWIGDKFRLEQPGDDSRPVIRLCRRVVTDYWRGQGIFQVNVTALDPRPARGQMDLFGAADAKAERLNRAVDLVNRRFGELTLSPANLLDRSTMPNVIAPAWKPYGHRQTIPDTRAHRGRPMIRKVYKMDE